MKKRALTFWREHRQIVTHGLAFLGIGLAYLALVLLTPLRIPCPVNLITGLSCPGCGISRFFVALARLDLSGAVRQNLAVAILLPLWLGVGAVEFFFNPKALEQDGKLVSILTWGSVILLLVFGIVRNLPGFEWLLPAA